MAREGHGTLSHETIYAMIYRDQKSGGDLHHFLPHPGQSYRDRSAGEGRRGRLKNQVIIVVRPSVVEEHTRVGDWEIDTLIGRTGGPVLLTMVERRSHFTHPYPSWERVPNKNTNGLIRQYFPEKTDFSTINQKDVKEIQEKLNRRPRKCSTPKPQMTFLPTHPSALAA